MMLLRTIVTQYQINYKYLTIKNQLWIAKGNLYGIGLSSETIRRCIRLIVLQGKKLYNKGASIYCREKPEDKADGAQKPECTRST